jgi:orotate phosphoribosyltransferase
MRYARVRDHGEEASFSKAQLPRIAGQSVIILNDFLTNGRSLVKMHNAVVEAGGNPAFAVALWNRGNVYLEHLPIKAFINRRLNHWHESECPLCKQSNTNLTVIGQRKPR